MTAVQARQMFDAYTVQLERLGFEQDANGQWFRPRSAVERFLG